MATDPIITQRLLQIKNQLQQIINNAKKTEEFPTATEEEFNDALLRVSIGGVSKQAALSALLNEVTDQDNIAIYKTLFLDENYTKIDVLNAISAMPVFTLTEKQSLWFKTFAWVVDGFSFTVKQGKVWKVANKGKGTYGDGGSVTLSVADLEPMPGEVNPTVEDVESAGNTVTIDLGTIDIGDFLFEANSAERVLTDTETFYLFKYSTDGSTFTLVAFIGTPGTYGGSGTALTEADFQQSASDDAPALPSVQSVTGSTVDNTDPLNPVVNAVSPEDLDLVINGTTVEASVFDASATYSDLGALEGFILDLTITQGIPQEFTEESGIFLGRIQNNGNGTFTMQFRKMASTSTITWAYTGAIQTGVKTITYQHTATANPVTITVILNFDQFVTFANTANSALAPINMDKAVNGTIPSLDPDSVVGKIGIAKQEALNYTDEQITAVREDYKEYTDERLFEEINGSPYPDTILDAAATNASKASIEAFIVDLTSTGGFDEDLPVYLRMLQDNGNGTFTMQLYYISNNSLAWEVTGAIPVSGQGTFSAGTDIQATVILDFDNAFYFFTNAGYTVNPVNMQRLINGAPILYADSLLGKIDTAKVEAVAEANDYTDAAVAGLGVSAAGIAGITNINPNGNFAGGYDFTDHPSTNNQANFSDQTITGDTNGITIDVDSYISGGAEILKYGFTFQPNTKYAVLVEYILNSTDIAQQDSDAGFSIRLSATSTTTFAFGGRSLSAPQAGELYRECIIQTTASNTNNTVNGLIGIKPRMTGLAGKSLNLTIKSIQIINLGTSSSPGDFYSIDENSLKTLVFASDYLTTGQALPVAERAEYALHTLNPYYGRYLITWGHSVVEGGTWQPYITANFGMKWDPRLLQDGGVDGYIETAIGGSYLVPVISNSTTQSAGKNHYMKLRQSFEYYNNKYTTKYGKPLHIFMFNFNDKQAGETYVAGNTYTVPSDFGINDPAWDYDTYGEINLITNPTTTNVPSFGAAYRAAMDYVFSVDPGADIMLLTAYQATSYGAAARDGHNAVTYKIGEEYSVPVLNWHSTLFNLDRHTYYLMDGIHLGKVGGKRAAWRLIQQM